MKEDTTIHVTILKAWSDITFILEDDKSGYLRNTERLLASTITNQRSGLCDGLPASLAEMVYGADRCRNLDGGSLASGVFVPWEVACSRTNGSG